ncbi:MAG TPA: hypothetical protein PLP29_13965 [Candidatus Ozemobacteraceae bacterium]|nr:hypothetical protein [Candidatus Ozemobacteraceae bacterium]
MKKFWMMMLVCGLLSLSMAVSAQPVADKDDGKDDDVEMVGPAERGQGKHLGLNKGEKLTADQVIERIRAMKEKILGRIRERLTKLPERLEKMESRADRLAERRAKRAGAGVASGTADRPGQAKEKITKRYEEIKSRIAKRREQFEQRSTQRRANFEQRIAHMNDADKGKVLAEFESAQKEIAAEIAKVADEALKKLEETYQRILAKFN